MSDTRSVRWLLGLLGGAFALRAIARRRAHFSLKGKVVVVTGGARGLGLVLARELADRGAKLVLVARDPHTLAEAHRELEERGADVLAVPCDVRDPSDVRQMVAAARATFGRIDALVNGAGEIEVGPLETMTLDDYARSMDTHFWGPLRTMRAVIDEMRARKSGRIVNIASIGGLIAVPHLSPYSASKHALVGLSDAIAAELAPHGIRVSTICPGLMRTGSPRNARFKGNAAAEYRWFAIGDTLPFTAMRARRAARRIADAIERGEPFVVIGLQARAAWLLRALFPKLFARLSALAARLLPAAAPGSAHAAWGWEAGPSYSPRSAFKNNELGWVPHT